MKQLRNPLVYCSLSIVAILGSLSVSYAADDATNSASASPRTVTTKSSETADVQELKQQLADQKAQIEELRLLLLDQKRQIDGLKTQPAENAAQSPASPQQPSAETSGLVASTTPIMVARAAAPKPAPLPIPQAAPAAAKPAAANPCEAVPEGQTPAFIRLGSTCIIPVGFMDLTAVWRDKNAASSLGSNFGSVPFNNVAGGKLSEFRFTPQNSRIGFRVDGDWKGTHFMGYNEFDFLGTSGSNALTVTNGAFVPRLRLFWIDVRKGKMEFLAGQSWSMLTPNRKGISALPGDLFYSQVVDVNYMAGLTWTRQPGMRILFHPSGKVTTGLSFENPDQYIGGSAGGSGITLPAALTALGGTQLDNAQNISAGNTVLAAPTVHPDIIAKIALDPSTRFHFEIAGLERTFKIWNPNAPPALGAGQYSTIAAGGVQFGVNAEVVKNFRLISTNYWSDGGGRYLFGQAPDVIVRADGSLSAVHSGGTVDGFEATIKNTLLYAYYGGIYIGRNTALDANGTSKIGYGVAAGNQNRVINEFTFGFNQTLWKNARYGAINAMGQYEYLMRDPWVVATGAPKAAHDNTIYFNLRYTLPGGMPSF